MIMLNLFFIRKQQKPPGCFICSKILEILVILLKKPTDICSLFACKNPDKNKPRNG